MVEYDLLAGDEIRYERIGNSLLMTPSPRSGREKITGLLYSCVLRHLDAHPIGRAYVTPCPAQLEAGQVLHPAILFISNQNTANFKAS